MELHTLKKEINIAREPLSTIAEKRLPEPNPYHLTLDTMPRSPLGHQTGPSYPSTYPSPMEKLSNFNNNIVLNNTLNKFRTVIDDASEKLLHWRGHNVPCFETNKVSSPGSKVDTQFELSPENLALFRKLAENADSSPKIFEELKRQSENIHDLKLLMESLLNAKTRSGLAADLAQHTPLPSLK